MYLCCRVLVVVLFPGISLSLEFRVIVLFIHLQWLRDICSVDGTLSVISLSLLL